MAKTNQQSISDIENQLDLIRDKLDFLVDIISEYVEEKGENRKDWIKSREDMKAAANYLYEGFDWDICPYDPCYFESWDSLFAFLLSGGEEV